MDRQYVYGKQRSLCFHAVRREMFIEPELSTHTLRSEQRNMFESRTSRRFPLLRTELIILLGS
jgi:hypothetical protein